MPGQVFGASVEPVLAGARGGAVSADGGPRAAGRANGRHRRGKYDDWVIGDGGIVPAAGAGAVNGAGAAGADGTPDGGPRRGTLSRGSVTAAIIDQLSASIPETVDAGTSATTPLNLKAPVTSTRTRTVTVDDGDAGQRTVDLRTTAIVRRLGDAVMDPVVWTLLPSTLAAIGVGRIIVTMPDGARWGIEAEATGRATSLDARHRTIPSDDLPGEAGGRPFAGITLEYRPLDLIRALEEKADEDGKSKRKSLLQAIRDAF